MDTLLGSTLCPKRYTRLFRQDLTRSRCSSGYREDYDIGTADKAVVLESISTISITWKPRRPSPSVAADDMCTSRLYTGTILAVTHLTEDEQGEAASHVM